MHDAHHTITIHSADSTAACGGCGAGADAGPVCAVHDAASDAACAAPLLNGPADELQRLLRALTPLLGVAQTSGMVRSLQVQPGEVELRLNLRASCGGTVLADSAFQLLRSLLPDTDIYVLPAR